MRCCGSVNQNIKDTIFYTLKYSFVLAVFFLVSCGGDSDTVTDSDIGIDTGIDMDTDNGDNQQDEENFDKLIEEVTNGSETLWRISSALLTNGAVEDLDVSEAFNIKDDEFIFKKGDGENIIVLEHRERNSFNAEAMDFNDFLLDYYQFPKEYTLNGENVTEKTFANEESVYKYVSASNIEGELKLDGATLTVELAPKMESDYLVSPSELNFTQVANFELSVISTGIGMVGSYHNNSLYVSSRETFDGQPSSEHVKQYNFETGSFKESIVASTDLATKRPHVIGEELIVVGGNELNTYDLDISQTPASIGHNNSFTRFGSSNANGKIYVIGSDFQDTDSDKIKLVDPETGISEIIAAMPTPKTWAGGEIVDNKLYIFSGQQFFRDSQPETLSYIYDFTTNSFQTFDFPVALFTSYATRLENLIYVAGQIGVDADNNGEFEDFNIYLGVYNTLDDTFSEVTTNLDDSGFSTIMGMTIYNGKIYVIYGDTSILSPINFSIMSTSLP